MENEIQVKPMVVPLIENVKVNKTILVYDLPAGDDYIVTLPVWGYAYYYINWGDGEETEIITDDTDSDNFPFRTLAGGRKYTIKIWGKIWRYGEFGVDSNEYLIEVKKIGPLDLSYAFHEASNLVKVPKHLPKGVTNLEGTFKSCIKFNYPLDKWDTSEVQYMNFLFQGCLAFNQPLNNWDTSKVIEMSQVFTECIAFNQPLNKWDTSNVTNMRSFFLGCTAFNQSLNEWNVSKITVMRSMFTNATSFNQPLNNWVLSTSNTNLSNMFSGATNFNHPLNNWNVSNVTNMSSMFTNAISFNQPLNNWNVSTVTNMASMFENAISFNQPLHNWDWTRITNQTYTANMLDYCGMSQYNYQLTLMGWYNIFNANILPANINGVSFGAKGLVYNNDRIIINSDPLVTAHDNDYFTPLNDISVNFDL
jgi:surface protein